MDRCPEMIDRSGSMVLSRDRLAAADRETKGELRCLHRYTWCAVLVAHGPIVCPLVADAMQQRFAL